MSSKIKLRKAAPTPEALPRLAPFDEHVDLAGSPPIVEPVPIAIKKRAAALGDRSRTKSTTFGIQNSSGKRGSNFKTNPATESGSANDDVPAADQKSYSLI